MMVNALLVPHEADLVRLSMDRLSLLLNDFDRLAVKVDRLAPIPLIPGDPASIE